MPIHTIPRCGEKARDCFESLDAQDLLVQQYPLNYCAGHTRHKKHVCSESAMNEGNSLMLHSLFTNLILGVLENECTHCVLFCPLLPFPYAVAILDFYEYMFSVAISGDSSGLLRLHQVDIFHIWFRCRPRFAYVIYIFEERPRPGSNTRNVYQAKSYSTSTGPEIRRFP